MTFAAEYFSHVAPRRWGSRPSRSCFASARARRGSRLVGAAGLLAGLAVSFEYPLGLLGAILFVYALARPVACACRARSPTPPAP